MGIAKWARGLAGLSVLGAVVVSSQACVEAEGNFYIRGASGTDGDPCEGIDGELTVDVGDTLDLEGNVLESGGQTRVDALVCVINQLKSRTDNGVETSNILFYQYDVSLDGGSTATRPTSGSVVAGAADGSAGFGSGGKLLDMIVISGTGLADLSGGLANGESLETVATLKLYGRTTGGIDLETPDFYLPILVQHVDKVCKCDATGDEVACPDAQCM